MRPVAFGDGPVVFDHHKAISSRSLNRIEDRIKAVAIFLLLPQWQAIGLFSLSFAESPAYTLI
jgi:hypothetical protein